MKNGLFSVLFLDADVFFFFGRVAVAPVLPRADDSAFSSSSSTGHLWATIPVTMQSPVTFVTVLIRSMNQSMAKMYPNPVGVPPSTGAPNTVLYAVKINTRLADGTGAVPMLPKVAIPC